MTYRRPTRRLTALLAALGVVAGGGVAFGASQSAQPEPTPAARAATVPSQLSAHFAALSAGAGLASASSATRSKLERAGEGGNAQFGLNGGLARRVAYGDSHLWIVPGSAGVCVDDFEARGGVCASIAQGLAGEVALGNAGNVVGLVPNGNSQVVVHYEDGSTEDVPVENNVYITGHPGPATAELTDATGQPRTVELPR